MTDRCEELLQARLDGELTSAQRAELEQLLVGDAAARERAGELEALVETLNLLGPVDPPARVIRTVIDHINETAPAALESPLATTGGDGMRTKVLWGLAAAAAIVLAVLAYTGFPPETGGSEGAIGAAKRYQAGQIAASDVKLGDQAAQEFLQSDLFDRLRKDEAVVAALSNPAIAKALSDPAFMKAIANAEWRAMLTDASFARALRDPGFARALSSADFAAALNAPGFKNALTDVSMGRALNDANLAKAFSDPALMKALTDPGLVKALSDVEMKQALTDVDLMKSLTNVDIAKALSDPALVRALTSADLQAALKSNGLSAALKSPQFGEAMRVAQ